MSIPMYDDVSAIDMANKVKNYTTLNNYTSSLGVPVNEPPFNHSLQILPYFDGVDYVNPNYNSLIIGNGCCNYPTVTQGYMDKPNNCVTYQSRSIPCGPQQMQQMRPQQMQQMQQNRQLREGYDQWAQNSARKSPYAADNSCECAN